jgi:hypothetical protein
MKNIRFIFVSIFTLFFLYGSLNAESLVNTLVVIDSNSPEVMKAQQMLMPYLDHFGLPYSVLDVNKQELPASVGNCPLIIIGHDKIARRNKAFLDKLQRFTQQAVDKGCGIVSFDKQIPGFFSGNSSEGQPEKTEVKAIRFTNAGHYITERHQPGEIRKLFGPMVLYPFSVKEADVLIDADGCPLLVTSKNPNLRVVQWASQDWMHTAVLGPMAGLDDCLWRSLVWAAKKPFALRGLPPLITMRVDDVAGRGGLWDKSPFYWVQTANKHGFKPWLGLFIYNLTPQAIDELRGYIQNGMATASPHALGRPPRNGNSDFYYYPRAIPLRANTYDEFIFFDHQQKKPWSDEQARRGLEAVDDWYAAHSPLPMSRYLVPHFYEIGSNTITHIAEKWGIEFVAFNRDIDLPWAPSSPWLKAGPFRLYEKPGTCTTRRDLRGRNPVYYADFIEIGKYRFFDCITEIRDDAGYEWAPDNNVEESVGRGLRQLKRALNAMALATLFTHETDYIYKIEPNNWDKELKLISDGISDYNPIFLTMDDALKIVRAAKTSRLKSCSFDPSNEIVEATFTGKTDVETGFYLFTKSRDNICSELVKVPQFDGTITIQRKIGQDAK